MNQNKVQLLGYYGGDKSFCLSAWQSTTEELDIELSENINDRVDFIFDHLVKRKKKTPLELLNFLAENNHETPFESSLLHFQILGDYASHIHAIKHRMSSINAESARYKEFQSDRFFIPDDWKVPVQTIESGDLKMLFDIFKKNQMTWADVLSIHSQKNFNLYHEAIKQLSPVLGRKRAKETSRFFLAQNTQINFDWKMNFRSFVNIQHLRNSDHAQVEIRQITNTMLYLVETIQGNPFEMSLKAFGLKSDPRFILEN